MLAEFLSIYKEGQFTREEVISSVKNISSDEKERYYVFLNLFFDVYDRYQNFLKRRKEYDFADLLKLGTEKLKNKSFKTNFKRIIVDEYQDISRGRYRFLKEPKGVLPTVIQNLLDARKHTRKVDMKKCKEEISRLKENNYNDNSIEIQTEFSENATCIQSSKYKSYKLL